MKKNYDRLVIILIIIVFIFLLGLYVKDTLKVKKQNTNEVVEKIESYNYTLKSNSSSYYKEKFLELKDILENNKSEEEYAKVLAQLFIIDFYTLDGKISNTDIGGIDFVLPSIKDNFSLKANETIYKYIENTTYGKNTELPIVSEVQISNIKNVTYTYNNEVDKSSYEIKVKINYQKDLGYEKEKTLYFVHSDNKLFLVEMK